MLHAKPEEHRFYILLHTTKGSAPCTVSVMKQTIAGSNLTPPTPTSPQNETWATESKTDNALATWPNEITDYSGFGNNTLSQYICCRNKIKRRKWKTERERKKKKRRREGSSYLANQNQFLGESLQQLWNHGKDVFLQQRHRSHHRWNQKQILNG